MTKYVLIISLGLIFLTLISCTHNNGGEPRLYGQWKLQRIVRDGVTDPSYDGGIFWKFQNKTIEMQEMLPNHETYMTFGNFRLADETLFFDFPDEDRAPLLGLPRTCEMGVVKLSGSEMVLTYGNPATIFYFKKW